MELVLKRIAFRPQYTIGKLYIDNEYFCDTLEDYDRGLTSEMSTKEIRDIKIMHQTAIPYGKYQLSMDIVSSKYSDREPYRTVCKGKLPRLIGVPGYDGILIHIGNSAEDTSGCILVGENKLVGKVINSTSTWKNLYNKLKFTDDDITIEITK